MNQDSSTERSGGVADPIEYVERCLPASIPRFEWQDGKGFSWYVDYPGNRSSLYKLGIREEDQKKDASIKTLWGSVVYGERTDGGLRHLSRYEINEPIGLDFGKEFFFDQDSNQYYHNNKIIQPNQIFGIMEEAHMRPSKSLNGLWLRTQLRWVFLLRYLINICDIFFRVVLWVISGARVIEDVNVRLVHVQMGREIPIEFSESKEIEFFGFKTRRWPVVFYSGIHLIIYAAMYYFDFKKPGILLSINSVPFLTLCYAIASFSLIEYLAPTLIKRIIKTNIPKIYWGVTTWRIKV